MWESVRFSKGINVLQSLRGSNYSGNMEGAYELVSVLNID